MFTSLDSGSSSFAFDACHKKPISEIKTFFFIFYNAFYQRFW